MKIPKCQETSRHYKLLLLDLVYKFMVGYSVNTYIVYIFPWSLTCCLWYLIVASVSVCIAVTLGEMALAMPSAGGQYVARVLAPKIFSF